MSLTAVLDVIIGLSFTYFLLALFSSWANERVAARFNRRGLYLFAGLREMLRANGAHGDTLNKFVTHPLIESLDRVREGQGPSRQEVDADATHKLRESVFPSYVPTATVATVLIDVISPKDGDKSFKGVRDSINALPDGKLKEALRTIADRADNDIEALRKGIEEWYSSIMDRVTGWYKGYAQMWLLVFGFFFALAFNVDTFKVVRELWANPAARAAAVQAATSATVVSDSQDVRKTLNEIKNATAEQKKAHYDKLVKQLDASRQLGKAFGSAEDSAIPVGWRVEHVKPFEHCAPGSKWDRVNCGGALETHAGNVLLKLLGIFVTGCAVALGAPFWFELINKLVDIRGAGRKPGENK